MIEQPTSHEIVRSVILRHHIHKDDFFGLSRELHLVQARIEAAQKLHSAGKTKSQIARVLKRNIDTIRYYLEPNIKRRKQAKYIANWPLAWLTQDVREIIAAFAAAEQTTPRAIISEWVCERARYEASQKKVA